MSGSIHRIKVNYKSSSPFLSLWSTSTITKMDKPFPVPMVAEGEVHPVRFNKQPIFTLMMGQIQLDMPVILPKADP